MQRVTGILPSSGASAWSGPLLSPATERPQYDFRIGSDFLPGISSARVRWWRGLHVGHLRRRGRSIPEEAERKIGDGETAEDGRENEDLPRAHATSVSTSPA